MDFSQALTELKSGRKLRRSGWATSGAYVTLMDLPGMQTFAAWHRPGQEPQPGWLCSQADMLAEDWQVVPQCDSNLTAFASDTEMGTDYVEEK